MLPAIKWRPLSWVWRLGLSSLVLTACAYLAPSCIDSKCYRNRDCAEGKICQAFSGDCVPPECKASSDCFSGRICENNQCVVGCLDDFGCAKNMKCIGHRCAVVEEECQCPLAPSFCQQDSNPASGTWQQSVCLPDSAPGGTLMLFGNVGCYHCQVLFAAVTGVQSKLLAEGLQPRVVWMQTKQFPASPAEIATGLSGATVPVLEDNSELGLWEKLGVDWYWLVILETHGCVAFRSGPLSPADVNTTYFEQVWRDSMKADCPTLPDAGRPIQGP